MQPDVQPLQPWEVGVVSVLISQSFSGTTSPKPTRATFQSLEDSPAKASGNTFLPWPQPPLPYSPGLISSSSEVQRRTFLADQRDIVSMKETQSQARSRWYDTHTEGLAAFGNALGARKQRGQKPALGDAKICKQDSVQCGAWSNVNLSELVPQKRAISGSAEFISPINHLSCSSPHPYLGAVHFPESREV